MEITCPYCDHVGDESEESFALSMANECFCPVCFETFQLADDDEEE
jgi:uncharacterized Zn-finger protein